MLSVISFTHWGVARAGEMTSRSAFLWNIERRDLNYHNISIPAEFKRTTIRGSIPGIRQVFAITRASSRSGAPRARRGLSALVARQRDPYGVTERRLFVRRRTSVQLISYNLGRTTIRLEGGRSPSLQLRPPGNVVVDMPRL
jgi:hypothetical protein